MSHGFPKDEAPLFRSTKFRIENRPGLEDQSTEGVIRELAKLNAPEVTTRSGGDHSKKRALAEWISDWHLIAFLATTQLISPGDIQTLLEVATSPRLFDDLSVLDRVLNSDGWQTLMTFTKEMSCEWPRFRIVRRPLWELITLLLQLQSNQRPSPPGLVAVWTRRSLLKYSIKYESQKWRLEGVVLRQGSGSANTVRSKTLTTGRIVRSAVFHCDDPTRSQRVHHC